MLVKMGASLGSSSWGLCCSIPGTFGAAMDGVGREGTWCCAAGLLRAILAEALHRDTSTTLLLLVLGVAS